MNENEGPRNPPWTRDELIVALDLYLRHRDRLPSPNDAEILDTSKILNQLAGALGKRHESFRNANSVYMKLGNFRSIDPQYVSQGLKGLMRGGKLDREVWEDFIERNKALAEAADAIRAIVISGCADELPFELEGITEAAEGKLLTRVHMSRERNQKLVSEKKRRTLEKHGTLVCETCGFDFEKRYGKRGSGFIEAHHLTPVHQLTPGTKTHLRDLALLCANCHRMIHAFRPWLSLGQLRACLTDSDG